MTLQGRIKVTQAEGLREAVICDLGLAVAAEWLFSPELKSGKVVPILQDWSLPPTRLSAVYPTGRLASAKARAFVSFVEGYMASREHPLRRSDRKGSRVGDSAPGIVRIKSPGSAYAIRRPSSRVSDKTDV